MSQDLESLLKEAPSLTLDPFVQEGQEPANVQTDKKEPVSETEKLKALLTPEEQRQVDAFAEQIDIANAQMVLQYGAGAQKRLQIFLRLPLEM